MSVASVVDIGPVTETYVIDVLDAIEERGGVTVVAAYLLGSAAVGDFSVETSDLDVVVVVDRAFAVEARSAVVAGIGRLGCPVRGLDLVVYVQGRQPPDFELNVNAHATAAVEKPAEPAFWFVVDAALAQERSVRFGDGPSWSALFEPVTPERLRRALAESIAWSERQVPDNEFARLNAVRSRHYLEHGEWLSKQEARR